MHSQPGEGPSMGLLRDYRSFAALLESVGGLQAVQWRAAAGGRPHNSIRIINVTRRGGRAQPTTAKNKQK